MEPPAEPRVSFDGQATSYEERAGLPDAICREVAAFVLDGAGASTTVVDIGAGTGTIGRQLLSAPVGLHYIGLDISRPMLAAFSRSLARARTRALLLQADADANWPIKDRAAQVILFSRSAHLLKSERTLAEVLRIAAPQCRVLVGRVRRPRESVGEQMKRTMQQMLRDRDIAGRNGERAKRDFLEALERRGGRPLPLRVTSDWSESEAPIASILAWKGKAGLGGRVVSDAVKNEILDELERWAEQQFGALTRARDVLHHYELEGVQLAQ